MSTTTSSVAVSMAAMEDKVLRPWRTFRLPRVVGVQGAAAILNVDKTTVYLWLKPGSGEGQGFAPDDTYMIPPVRVGKTADDRDEDDGWPIWDRRDVFEFALLVGRRRAPVGQAKPRRRNKEPAALRAQIARLQAQLAAAEAKTSSAATSDTEAGTES